MDGGKTGEAWEGLWVAIGLVLGLMMGVRCHDETVRREVPIHNRLREIVLGAARLGLAWRGRRPIRQAAYGFP
jgi:hypothetical protein